MLTVINKPVCSTIESIRCLLRARFLDEPNTSWTERNNLKQDFIKISTIERLCFIFLVIYSYYWCQNVTLVRLNQIAVNNYFIYDHVHPFTKSEWKKMQNCTCLT